VETSAFGAKFVAKKNGMETMRGLKHKLCMMGFPIEGPARVCGWGQHVAGPQHTTSQVHVEAEIKFCLPPSLQRVSCGKRMHDWGCTHQAESCQPTCQSCSRRSSTRPLGDPDFT
jgi:hypothetical protein